MATVTNTIKLPGGATPAYASVEIELIASSTGAPAAGWVAATDVTILARYRPTVTAGAWTADLTPNADIDPAGTVYRVTEYADKSKAAHYIEVGSGGGTVHDLLTSGPSSLVFDSVTNHNASGSAHSGFYRSGGTDVAIADGGTGASSALAARTGLDVQGRHWFDVVKEYGVVLDSSAAASANRTAILDALADIDAAGGGVIYFPPGTCYVSGGTFQVVDRCRWLGEPGLSTINSLTSVNLITNNSKVEITNLEFDGLVFVGAVDTPTAPLPKRSRTSTGTGMQSAIHLRGELYDPAESPLGGVRIANCEFRNLPTLPFLLYGASDVVVTDNLTSNTMDMGFVSCEQVVVSNNRCEDSADNGISVSRGCSHVSVTGNVIISPAHDGIWLSGFDDVAGPTDVACAGNSIYNAGKFGISCQDAPKRVTISGNVIDTVGQGPTDALSNSVGDGIVILGLPYDTPTSPTDYAEDIAVVGNTIYNVSRNGVTVQNAKRVLIDGNIFNTFGSRYLVDGVTAVASTNQDRNCGVTFPLASGSAVQDLNVANNLFIDTRGTPYGNYAISAQARAATRATEIGNRSYNLRQPLNGAAKLGESTDNDNLPRLTIDGPAGVTRSIGWATSGVRRFEARLSTASESGANAGSDLEIARRSDGGTFLGTPVSISRSSGEVTLTSSGGVVVNGVRIRVGSGSPTGVYSDPVGSLYLRTDGGAGSTLYVKEASGSTWAAK